MRKTIPISPSAYDSKKIPVSVPSSAPEIVPQAENQTASLPVEADAPVVSHKSSGKIPPSEMLEVEIKDKKQLQAVYMPFLTNGGIFLPTAKEYVLGEEVYLNMHLLKESRQYTVIGRVAWITPRNALNKRIQGVGIHFSLDENTGITKRKIEELLGAAVKSDKSTHTL